MNQSVHIPCCLMRGGTSKGPFFRQIDLPDNIDQRNQILLSAIGSPDSRQINGLGGAHPLTSKVGIVSTLPPPETGAQLSFLFAQLQPHTNTVDTTPNCGNMLAAVVPFALEMGLIKAKEGETTVRVLTQNTGLLSDITVQTPHGQLTYQGDTIIDGVPGSSAPIKISFLDSAGSVCDCLLPTGNIIDNFDIPAIGHIQVTCIDNGMPMILVNGHDFDCTGNESAAQLNQNNLLKSNLEALRLIAAQKMGLANVSDKNYPKMCLLSEPLHGGTINTHCFIPHVCHEAIGVMAAVTVATACVLPDSVAYNLSKNITNINNKYLLSIEHPSGKFDVELKMDLDENAKPIVVGAALLRTARLIMKGEVLVFID